MIYIHIDNKADINDLKARKFDGNLYIDKYKLAFNLK